MTPGEIKSKADKLTYILYYDFQQQQQKETIPEQPYLHHSEALFQLFLTSGTYSLPMVDWVTNVLVSTRNQLMQP